MTLALLDRGDAAPDRAISLSTLLGLDDGASGGKKLVCSSCGHPITTTRARIEIAGAHEHTRVNPAGLVFHIGCFRAAPGAVSWGGERREHTWFTGYGWQIALCAACGTHLGWAFRAADDRFHGMILDRLRLEGDEGPAH